MEMDMDMDIEMEMEGSDNSNEAVSDISEQEPEDFKIIFDNEKANIPIVRSVENSIKYVPSLSRSPNTPHPSNAAALPPPENAPQYYDHIPPDKSVLDFDAIANLPFHNWRNPQADLSDYFNYGRDEYSWWLFSKYIQSGDAASGEGCINVQGHQFGIPRNLLAPFQLMILCLDIKLLKEQPWQIPGADLSDYFNYGHNVEEWRQYCKDARILLSELHKSRVNGS